MFLKEHKRTQKEYKKAAEQIDLLFLYKKGFYFFSNHQRQL